jgi:hypothetical protein
MTALAANKRETSEYVDDPVALIELRDEVRSPSPPRTWRRHLAASGGTISLGLAALYLWCPVHRFPQAQPFHGARWYNPYAGVTPATNWRKVNLHSHAHAWSGLTNGRGSADDVLRRYQAMGYDAAPVSNYQTITRASSDDAGSLTVYEQGFNLRKVHFLAVGARRVDWLDYPLLQGRDEEQHRIDRLRTSAGLVIIAHPRLRRGVPDADLRVLTGYTAIEIGSNASQGEDAWNVALDAGRPVWGVANDDNHDASSPNEAGGYWSMIASSSNDGEHLVEALVAGRAYAVFGSGGQADVALTSLSVVGDTMSVAFEGAPAHLQLIGPGGRVLEETNQAHDTRWTLPCDAGWVRVVARTPTTQLSLEPLLRSDNGALPRPEASIARTATLVRRAIAIMLLFIAVLPWVGGDVLRLSRPESARPDLALRNAA